jgi:membrane protease YdiL (CAAX protease family)
LFPEQAFTGKNQFWRYLVSIFLIIIAYFIGQIPLTVVIAMAAIRENRLSEISSDMDFTTLGINQNLFLILALLMFVFSFITLLLVARFIHHKPFRSIITARPKFDLSRFFFAAGVWFVLTLLFECISYGISPEIYQFNFNLMQFIPLFFIVLLGIPIQAGFEELFLRGYLLQAIGIIGRYRWVPLLITSLLFGILHSLNPEIAAFGFWFMMVYYIGYGLCMAVITLMDDGLELAVGVHISSNVYASLLVTYEGSVLKTSALVKVTELDVAFMLAGYFICMALFMIIVAKKYAWHEWNKLYRKIIRL